jgi:hypothetical protein
MFRNVECKSNDTDICQPVHDSAAKPGCCPGYQGHLSISVLGHRFTVESLHGNIFIAASSTAIGAFLDRSRTG